MKAKQKLLRRWRELEKNSSAARATGRVENALSKHASSPEQIALIADAQDRRGDVEKALQTLETGKKLFPSNQNISFRWAFLLEKYGRLEEAKEAYLSLAGNQGADEQVTYRLAVTLQRLNEPEEALSWAVNFCTTNPADARGNRLAYELAAKQPIWKRLDILKNATGELASDVRWQSDIIALSYKMRKYETCVEAFSVIQKKAERRAVAHAVAAFMELGRPDEAWQVAKTHLAKSTARTNEMYPGSLMQDLGAWHWAKELYIRSYVENPSIELAYLIGFASTRLFDWAEAIEWFRAAVPGSRDSQKIRYYLGTALEREGNWAAAARDYLKSAQSASARNYRIYRALHCFNLAGDLESASATIANLDWTQPPAVEGFEVVDARFPSLEYSLRRSLSVAMENQRISAIEFVAREAIDAKLWKVAVEAAEALVARDSFHKIDNFLVLAQAREGAGDQAGALEAILESRIYREPSIVEHSTYEKNRVVRNGMRFGGFQKWYTIDSESILYESNHGTKLTCNVLPLLQSMVDHPKFQGSTHYVVLPDRSHLPESLRHRPDIVVVSRESDLYLRKLASARILINNNTFPSYFSRRAGQTYLNLWHGTPIKAMGKDIKNGNFDYRNAARNFLHVTHFALPNRHTEEQLLSKYGISDLFEGFVELTGSPRMDITFSVSPRERASIRERLGIKQGQKAVLFAPTWRGALGNVEPESSAVATVMDRINEQGYYGLYRGHPVSAGAVSEDALAPVTTVPDDIDTNVLLGCVDAVITDYSSIAFDAASAGLPVGLFAYDEEVYAAERGLSLDIHDIGLPVLTDAEELTEWLETIRASKSNTLDEEFSHLEDGSATSRVIEFLLDPRPSSWRESSPDNILLFEGHFIPNGITSAAVELNKVLARAQLNPTIAVEPSAITPFDERAESFAVASKHAAVLPRIAGSTDTAEQRWLIARQHQGHLMTAPQLAAIHEAYEAEFSRLFGAAQFRTAVGFEGFSLYWSNLFAAANADRKVGYLHADMVEEARYRFPYLWKVFDTYRYFDALACVSGDAREQNRRKLDAWTRSEQFVTAENLIDVQSILSQSEGVLDDAFLEFCDRFKTKFVSVGRVSVEKGSDRLIRAFLQVAEANEDVGLVLIGDGPLRLELERATSLSGYGDRIYFAGQLASPFSHMRECDSLVLASHHEGQGIVVLEAFVLGLRVLSVDIPGPRSMLAGGTGLLVENSTEGLSRGMQQLIDGYWPESLFDASGYVQQAKRHALLAVTGVVAENGDDFNVNTNTGDL